MGTGVVSLLARLRFCFWRVTPNLESNLNTLLDLNHAVRDEGLNTGMSNFPRMRMSNASDADGGGTRMPKKREGERLSFDSTSGSGLLPTMRNVS